MICVEKMLVFLLKEIIVILIICYQLSKHFRDHAIHQHYEVFIIVLETDSEYNTHFYKSYFDCEKYSHVIFWIIVLQQN